MDMRVDEAGQDVVPVGIEHVSLPSRSPNLVDACDSTIADDEAPGHDPRLGKHDPRVDDIEVECHHTAVPATASRSGRSTSWIDV